MADIKFEDYSFKVKDAIKDALCAGLEEAAGELESQVKRNSRVGTTRETGNSFKHRVVDAEYTAYVGSDEENAIWEEFGTGEYAITENGGKGGRKTPWYVPVDSYIGKKKPTYNGKVVVVYGKNKKKYYKTNGKKPSRAFWNTYTSQKASIINLIQNKLKGL